MTNYHGANGEVQAESRPCLNRSWSSGGKHWFGAPTSGGGGAFVSLMISTTKNNKISVKIADYGVLEEYEQAADLNLEK